MFTKYLNAHLHTHGYSNFLSIEANVIPVKIMIGFYGISMVWCSYLTIQLILLWHNWRRLCHFLHLVRIVHSMHIMYDLNTFILMNISQPWEHYYSINITDQYPINISCKGPALYLCGRWTNFHNCTAARYVSEFAAYM